MFERNALTTVRHLDKARSAYATTLPQLIGGSRIKWGLHDTPIEPETYTEKTFRGTLESGESSGRVLDVAYTMRYAHPFSREMHFAHRYDSRLVLSHLRHDQRSRIIYAFTRYDAHPFGTVVVTAFEVFPCEGGLSMWPEEPLNLLRTSKRSGEVRFNSWVKRLQREPPYVESGSGRIFEALLMLGKACNPSETWMNELPRRPTIVAELSKIVEARQRLAPFRT